MRRHLLQWTWILGAALLAGCHSDERRERIVIVPATTPQRPVLTAEQARQAVLDLVRQDPNAFIGNPDADKLADMPLTQEVDGTYHFGAFTLDPANRTYSAVIGAGSPEPYFYNGTFLWQKGQWVASNPTVQRVHQRP
jgi:hypothetical protein